VEDRGAGGDGGLDSSIVNLSGYVRSALMRVVEQVFDDESSFKPTCKLYADI
jgi:hypothetical protein